MSNFYAKRPIYLIDLWFFMKEDKKWMLMTYYCPTHGDLGRIEPIEMKRDEILKVLSQNNDSKK